MQHPTISRWLVIVMALAAVVVGGAIALGHDHYLQALWLLAWSIVIGGVWMLLP